MMERAAAPVMNTFTIGPFYINAATMEIYHQWAHVPVGVAVLLAPVSVGQTNKELNVAVTQVTVVKDYADEPEPVYTHADDLTTIAEGDEDKENIEN